MTTTARLEFEVSATGPDLRLQVILDGQIIWDDYPSEDIQNISYDFDDSMEQEHVLQFHMRGKRPEHTVIDQSGTILQDRCIQITNMTFDTIELGHLFNDNTLYHHDHNGNSDLVTEPFYGGVMGCNGVAELRFSSPIYLWLLETM